MPFDTLECRKFLPHLIGNFCLPCQVRLQVFATFFLRWCRNQNDQYNNPKDSYLPDCMSRLLLNNIRCYGLCLLVTLEPTVDVFCGYVEPLNSFGALSFGSEAWTNAFGEGGTSSSPSSKSTSCKCRFACTMFLLKYSDPRISKYFSCISKQFFKKRAPYLRTMCIYLQYMRYIVKHSTPLYLFVSGLANKLVVWDTGSRTIHTKGLPKPYIASCGISDCWAIDVHRECSTFGHTRHDQDVQIQGMC